MNTQFTVEQVMQGFILSIEARHLSKYTIRNYTTEINRFVSFVGPDIPITDINRQHIEEFLKSLTDLTNKTILHYHTSLSAMWTWAVRENITPQQVVHMVTPPKPESREVQPFTESEVKAMLAAVSRSKAYYRPGKRTSDHGLIHADRTRAIILLLVDTGLRAGELSDLRLHQLDQRNNRVQVLGKGAQERSVPFSPRTAQAIWRYLASRPSAESDEHLFTTNLNKTNRKIDRTQIGKILKRVAQRAGVKDVHPHRFRHTFAIQYLRNGGDPYTLQRLLGHSTLDMVKRYLALAQVDLDRAHKRASPVDNWAL